ncbi:MAG: carboxypeptidase-like regulatory domain-containing protein [Cyanobacteria bacterium]|nr:carboxypeptidase-like regulatory domain-containing protein [Cyanobacteriota bacterium]
MQVKQEATTRRKKTAAAWIVGLLILQCVLTEPAEARKEEKYVAEFTISGRVVDMVGKPIDKIRVDLWTKEGSLSLSTKTDKRGSFKFVHEKCQPCYLEVLPRKESQMACATIDNISGEENRSIIVNLKRGYLLSGRVCAGDKGLPGVVVKVYSEEHEKNPTARVYGGGAVKTGRDGKFEMVLTPGKKHLVVINNKFSEIKRRTEANFEISADMELEDVKL